MKRRVISVLLAAVMFLTPMQVHAQNVEAMKYTFTNMDNLVVTIPSDIDLAYEYGIFKGAGEVTVEGHVLGLLNRGYLKYKIVR